MKKIIDALHRGFPYCESGISFYEKYASASLVEARLHAPENLLPVPASVSIAEMQFAWNETLEAAVKIGRHMLRFSAFIAARRIAERQMNTSIIVTLALATAAGSAAAASASASDNASSSSKSESSASFTGRNGLARVNGDTIEARNGELRVNGIPYGKVSAASVVKYSTDGKDKTVTVDGVPRAPLSEGTR